MSKTLAFVASSRARSTAAVDAATKVLSAVGVTLKPTTVAGASTGDGNVLLAGPLSRDEIKALGAKLGGPLHSSTTLTAPSSAINPDKTYEDAKFAVVRSNIPDPSPVSVSYVDRIDRFPKNGIATTEESAYVKGLAEKTAATAVAVAQEKGVSKVTLVQKPQPSLAGINGIYTEAVKAAAAASISDVTPTGLSVEVITTSQAVNAAVMFSKTLGVVVAPDYAAADSFESICVGVAGGLGMVAQKHSGDGVSVYAQAGGDSPAKFDPSANPTGLLFAAAGALKEMGSSAEADKIVGALGKVYGAGKVLPSDVSGGNANASAFADAVKAAL